MKYQNEIIRIIKETIPMTSKIDNINLNSILIDIGVDSVAYVRLLVELEKYFHITFLDTALSISREFKVRDLCDAVNSAIQDMNELDIDSNVCDDFIKIHNAVFDDKFQNYIESRCTCDTEKF